MIHQKIDDIEFKMKQHFDFEFIHKYGTVFKVFDDQDSGNICFGVKNGDLKYFIKFAGAQTAEYNGSTVDAITRLKSTLPIYQELSHKNLIEFIDAEEIGNGFLMIFKWAEGECMARMYPESHKMFMALPIKTKLNVFSEVIDFFKYLMQMGYVAIDFYDGSIMYDEKSNKTTICDIDFFRKSPAVNDMGKMWGSDRFMSPEEYRLNDVIDEITNIYTLGATAFSLFTDSDTSNKAWVLNDETYKVLCKSISKNRNCRYKSINEFATAWHNAVALI